jgi:hypothetical protein
MLVEIHLASVVHFDTLNAETSAQSKQSKSNSTPTTNTGSIFKSANTGAVGDSSIA